MLTIILIAIVVLLVVGLGWEGFMDALYKGYESVPTEKIADNFKDAAIESLVDVKEEIEERAEPSIDDLKVDLKGTFDGLKIDFKPKP